MHLILQERLETQGTSDERATLSNLDRLFFSENNPVYIENPRGDSNNLNQSDDYQISR